jgi:uncharacterized protein DUF4345
MTDQTRTDGGRRARQVTLGTLSAIPFASGLAGMLAGPASLPGRRSVVAPTLDNEYRYAHAVWFAVAPLIWWVVPRVERETTVVGALSATVVLGGLARSLSWRSTGRPHPMMVGAIALELVGVPAVAAWQRRVARLAGTA